MEICVKEDGCRNLNSSSPYAKKASRDDELNWIDGWWILFVKFFFSSFPFPLAVIALLFLFQIIFEVSLFEVWGMKDLFDDSTNISIHAAIILLLADVYILHSAAKLFAGFFPFIKAISRKFSSISWETHL